MVKVDDRIFNFGIIIKTIHPGDAPGGSMQSEVAAAPKILRNFTCDISRRRDITGTVAKAMKDPGVASGVSSTA